MKLKAIISELERKRTLGADDLAMIKKAYSFADKAHAGQKRRSGDSYFIHCEEAALTIARWGLDTTTVAAALLHDVVEDTENTRSDIELNFGKDVAFLVEGVSKISKLKYRGNQLQAETLKKMILALSEDVRVVFVKLADRLHNMRTLNYLPTDKQKRIALETEEIYAPLAYRLGLGSVQGELLDMTFPYLHPKEHRLLSEMLKEHLEQGEVYVEKVERALKKSLGAHPEINWVRIDSRAKRLSSLYKKMQRYEMNLDRIHDLFALRVIVKNVEDCYAVLGLIHQMWPPLPGLIKDYIALPKPNGYRSIHTTVICMQDKPTEFQIRTEEMHFENEYGIAAYWAYSEAKSSKGYQQENKQTVFADAKELAWINQLRSWQKQMELMAEDTLELAAEHDIEKSKRDIDVVDDEGMTEHESEEEEAGLMGSLKIDFFKDRIFTITPKGEVVDLAAGSTPIDFAYAIHSQIGNSCVGAKVNGKIVVLSHELESGDVVEILTQKNKKKPSESWLNFAKTARARGRIRTALRESGSILVPPIVRLNVVAEDRIGMVKEIGAVFARLKVGIESVNVLGGGKGELKTIKLAYSGEHKDKTDKLMLGLKRIVGVKQVAVV